MSASVRSESVTQQSDWCTHHAGRFVFHYLSNSYAASYLPWLSRRAERAWDAMQAWHAHDEASRSPISIHLLPVLAHPERPQEKLTHGAYADTAARRVWAVCRPESPAEGLEVALGHLIIFQHLGPAAGRVPFLRAGLVAWLLGQPDPSSSTEPATAATQEDDQRALVNVTAGMAECSIVNQRQNTPIASSFISFLADKYGVPALQEFIRRYDPGAPEIAAIGSFQAPLGAIAERWMTTRRGNHEPHPGVGKLLWRLLPYTRPYTGQVIVIMVYMLVALGFSLGLQLSIKFLIDNVITDRNIRLLSEMLAAGLIAYVVNAVVSLRRAYIIAWVSERIILRLRLDVFTHLQYLSAAFYGRARLGDIISRLSIDIVLIQVALSRALLGGLFYVLSLVCAAIILFLLDWRLATVVLVAVPALFVSTVALSARVVRASRERAECLADMTDILQESLNAQAVVRAFGLHECVIEQFNHGLQRLFHRAVRVMLFGSLFRLLTDLITSLIQLLTLGIGAYLLLTGDLSLGAMFSFIGLLSAVTSPVENISELNQSLQQAAGSMERIVELLDEETDILDAPDAALLPRLAQQLRFDSVSFGYSPDRPVLQDVSFVISAGAHVAIVGPSGAGKSSVINLLMRFYDPQRGRILLDGVDLRTGTQESLRKQIGVVSQDTFLFNTTIWKNLAYGRLDASEDEIVAAARDAEIHDFILGLPEGYATVVGDRGARLSGGQRQRLAIARALVRRPSILLLDEATSALDPETELHIHATLSRIAEGLTTIMVTHRLASAASADCILLLDRGLLVEHGTHADLMAAGRLYARLYAEQHSGILAGSAAMRQVDRLRRVPLFAALPVGALAAIDRELQLERYASGDTIVRQGEAGDKLYILDRGRVEVIIERGAGDYRLNVLSESDYFGEIALLQETPRTATVRALGPVQVLTLGKTDFQKLFQQVPDIAQRFGATVERRLAEQRGAIAGA